MRKDNAPPVTKGNNNDNARLAQLEFSSIHTYRVHTSRLPILAQISVSLISHIIATCSI